MHPQLSVTHHRNPQKNATQDEGCIDLFCVATFIRLNVSTLSEPDSLFTTLSISKHSLSTRTLIDSGSSDCFIDLAFVTSNNIPTILVAPTGLRLFDGTCNAIITQVAELPVNFPTGERFNLTFYVTLLDSSCSMVLGYNWLKQYNPLIDWISGHIYFHSSNHRGLAPLTSPVVADSLMQTPPPANTPLASSIPIPDSNPEIPETPKPFITPPPISMINTTAYLHASKLPGSITFQLQLTPDGLFGKATTEVPADLSLVPKEFHKYADGFSKGKADALPLHRSYDLKINLEEGTLPPSRMYSLSQSKLETLCTFFEEHVNLGFIRPSKCPHGTPILFMKKKDSSL
jgi:Retroviral aspartyl protease